MDFRVYHYGARGVFDGTRPVYGASSGLGWPMHYRYPPLFLLLFAPLTLPPLGIAAAIWVSAKIAILVWLLAALARRKLIHSFGPLYFVPALVITPYLIEEFRYGNAQFFVVALTSAALLLLAARPVWAGLALGLAISIKVWPAFFLPYLAARRDWKGLSCTLAFVAAMALLPALYFGFSGNLQLLGQWLHQESATQLGENEIWFPNQSLRGVLMRYLTVVDYSQVPDSNYARVNVTAIDPATVRLVWMLLAAGAYAAFLVLINRRRAGDGRLDVALGFCLLALLQPFTQKYALAVLLWPALAMASLTKKASPRAILYCAAVLVLVQPLVPGAGAQRLLQVLGLDFAATVLLTSAITLACLDRHLPSQPANRPSERASDNATAPSDIPKTLPISRYRNPSARK